MNNYRHVYSKNNDRVSATQANPDTPSTTPANIGMIPNPPFGVPQQPDTGLMPIPQQPDTGLMPIPQHPSLPSNPSISYIQFLLQQCLYNMVYITTSNGEQFWYYPQDFYQNSVNGYRWNARAGWFPYSIQLSNIWDLFCYNP